MSILPEDKVADTTKRFEIFVLLKRTPIDREIDGRIEYINYNYYLLWSGDSLLQAVYHLIKACKMSKIIKIEWRRNVITRR